MTAPGTSGLFMVAMVGHQLRCGEVFDVGNPLGGVWLISARSVHDGLPEEKKLGAAVSLQRHFRVLTKFAHVESRLSGRKRQREVVFYAPVNLCDRRACFASVAVGVSML